MEVPDDGMFDYLELTEIKAFADTEELVERWKAWEETYFFIVQNYMIAFMKKCSALNTIEWHLCGCSLRRRTAQPVWLWRRIKKKARRDVLVSSEDPSCVKEGTFVLGDLFIPSHEGSSCHLSSEEPLIWNVAFSNTCLLHSFYLSITNKY